MVLIQKLNKLIGIFIMKTTTDLRVNLSRLNLINKNSIENDYNWNWDYDEYMKYMENVCNKENLNWFRYETVTRLYPMFIHDYKNCQKCDESDYHVRCREMVSGMFIDVSKKDYEILYRMNRNYYRDFVGKSYNELPIESEIETIKCVNE
jgi:hypothetical protein